ncbi:MAG: hypothetical protein ACYCWA_05245 [Thiobacillus sp.]
MVRNLAVVFTESEVADLGEMGEIHRHAIEAHRGQGIGATKASPLLVAIVVGVAVKKRQRATPIEAPVAVGRP